MIEEGDRVLLVREDREFYVQAGNKQFATDLGTIDLSVLIGSEPGDVVRTHMGSEFVMRIPRAPDFFTHAARSGAPMLPKDIGLVIAHTGMNRHDEILDAGTGSGIAVIYYAGIAKSVKTYEIRSNFSKMAAKNLKAARIDNVEIVEGDILTADGKFDIVHLDMHMSPEHIALAHNVLRPGGFLACYSPFLEQLFLVVEEAKKIFPEVHIRESIEREIVRSVRGTRPSTRVSHSGYLTFARK
jgi:tRNA (adenine57-N1/adenine58-N1)-methyltransferase